MLIGVFLLSQLLAEQHEHAVHWRSGLLADEHDCVFFPSARVQGPLSDFCRFLIDPSTSGATRSDPLALATSWLVNGFKALSNA